MSVSANPRFPFRLLLGGELRGKSVAEVRALAGEPKDREGDIWIYRMPRVTCDTETPALGDPRSVEVQFWFFEDRLQHAWVRLVFADGLDYQELLH